MSLQATSDKNTGRQFQDLYFCLKGLFHPYHIRTPRYQHENPWPDTRLFYLRRILRIIPGYYFSLFLLVLLSTPNYLQPQNWKHLLLFLIFFMDSCSWRCATIPIPFCGFGRYFPACSRPSVGPINLASLWPMAVACLVILFDTGAIKRFFEWTPLRWIGLISYSLYLWHQPILDAFEYAVGPSLVGLNHGVACILVYVWEFLVTFPFAFVIYVQIERPAMRLSDRLRRQRRTRQVQPRGNNVGGEGC
jgi:peptidoglycan/LPS O-acetylase OafA/YrhL